MYCYEEEHSRVLHTFRQKLGIQDTNTRRKRVVRRDKNFKRATVLEAIKAYLHKLGASASFWGVWTFFVNWNGGVGSAIISSIVQAGISAVSITFLSLGMNFFLKSRISSIPLRVTVAATLPYLILLTVIIVSHIIAKTHNIIATILPWSSIGIVYSWLHCVQNRSSKESNSSKTESVVQ